MAMSAEGLIYLDVAHTGGRDVPSDIVVSDDLLERALVIVNADPAFFDEDDDDMLIEDYDGFTDAEEDADGPLWIWRRPRWRKG